MRMRTSEPPRPKVVWALWAFFTAATVGFVTLLGGIFGDVYGATLSGAGLMAFATMIYLFVSFWTTAHASFAASADASAIAKAAPAAAPRRPSSARVPRVDSPSASNPFNFDHLLAHTLEPTAAPQPQAAAEWGRGPMMEQAIMATTSPMAVERRVPATERRSEWIGGLPIIKDVLGETGRATDPSRPGKTKGQCSNCRTLLWAPTQRPIRLRCPKCSKVAWLEK